MVQLTSTSNLILKFPYESAIRTKIMSSALLTSMHFLARRDDYKIIKPYSLRFEPEDPSLAKTNIKLECHEDIEVEDIRSFERCFTLDADGFTVLKLDTAMAYEDFDDEDKILQVYLKETADMLLSYCGATKVQIFEHTVC